MSDLKITLLGELRVQRDGAEVPLPASRKARALLAFLVDTDRPHRRERLCELFWDLPDDPKASLRWSLSKLRKIVDNPERPRIVADRERVLLDTDGLFVDLRDARERLRYGVEHLSVTELEELAQRLDAVPLDGLDGAGGDAYRSWLAAVREDVHAARVTTLRLLATHRNLPPVSLSKWVRLWRIEDPDGAAAFERSAHETRSSLTGPSHGLFQESSVGPLNPDNAEWCRSQWTAPAVRAQRINFCEAPDGTKIAYATVGSGPPMLKAANWLTHLEFDWTTPIWGACFSDIARERTLIRYDERGCGLSDWEVGDLSFEAFVEDLEIVADKLSLERFPLLGISQGAAVSIEYAVRHPERVSGLILLGSYAAGWRHAASDEEKARREAVKTLTEVGWGTDNPAYRHIFSQTFMPDASSEDLAWFDEFQRLTTSPRNAARFQDAFGYIDVRDRLSLVRAPTIVLHAKEDQRIPLEDGRAVASGIRDASFVPLESPNHVLVGYEPAWPACMAAIRAFLAEHDI